MEQIILYTGYPGGGPAPWIGIRRREGAPALLSGNEQALFCPVPGVAAGATRRNKGLRLDRERLAAITATVAPGSPSSRPALAPARALRDQARQPAPQRDRTNQSPRPAALLVVCLALRRMWASGRA